MGIPPLIGAGLSPERLDIHRRSTRRVGDDRPAALKLSTWAPKVEIVAVAACGCELMVGDLIVTSPSDIFLSKVSYFTL